MNTMKLEKLVLKKAMEYYETDETEAEKLLVEDYGNEALHGYIVSGYASDIGELEHIERLDFLDIFTSDLEAGRQAEKDGITLIPYSKMTGLRKLPYRYYRYVDNAKNRAINKVLAGGN